MTIAKTFVEQSRERLLSDLTDLLRIPSVSADPARSASCRQAAEWVRDRLVGLGCAVEFLGSETHPVVHASGPPAPGKPTVLIYGHYDVQPPDPLDQWRTPPFEPATRDGYLYARGATDDKGQFFAAISACEAVLAAGPPPVNFRFLIEGGEETGSDVVVPLIHARPELVAADVALVADGPFYAPGWPAAEVGVRGLCYAEIHVRTLEHDLHSGLFGGVAPNAHNALVQILSALTGGRGRIRIPGVYRSVRRPSKAERNTWEALPFDEEDFTLKGAGATGLVGDPRKSVHERLWALPTLDIHGISGGFTGDGVKTVIPAEARAKVSLRLVPDQKAKEIFAALERYVHSLAPNYATVTVRPLILTDPVIVDTGHPSFALLDQSFKAVFGRGLSLVRSGGSLPILGELGRSGAAVLMAGIGLADDGLHAPNERFSIEQFLKGIQVFADFFQRLGADTEGGGT